jgi:hypothetical protein
MDFIGTQTESTSKGYIPYTGLGNCQVVTINPSKEELEEILGVEINYTPEYKAQPNMLRDNAEEFPYVIWVKSEAGNLPIRFNISNQPKSSKSGKFLFINDKGQVSYYAENANVIAQNSNMPWYGKSGLRKLYEGEEELYDFFKTLIRYDAQVENANFMKVMQENGITPETLYNGEAITGLRKLIEYAKTNGNSIVCLHAVAEKEEGKYKQSIIARPKTWFKTATGIVDGSMEARLDAFVKEKESEGYPISRKYFTTKALAKFKVEDCYNYVKPDEKDDLPF